MSKAEGSAFFIALEVNMTEFAAIIGIFFGCLSRSMLPFLRKKHQEAQQGNEMKWEKRYTWTIVFSVFISCIATMLVLPSFNVPYENIFPLAFATGWATEDILNTLAK